MTQNAKSQLEEILPIDAEYDSEQYDGSTKIKDKYTCKKLNRLKHCVTYKSHFLPKSAKFILRLR